VSAGYGLAQHPQHAMMMGTTGLESMPVANPPVNFIPGAIRQPLTPTEHLTGDGVKTPIDSQKASTLEVVQGGEFLSLQPSTAASTTSSNSARSAGTESNPIDLITPVQQISESNNSLGTRSSSAAVPKKLSMDRETINRVAEDCIERLAESQQYVSLERIEKLVLQQYGAATLYQLNIRRLDELQCVYKHIRMECKVSYFKY